MLAKTESQFDQAWTLLDIAKAAETEANRFQERQRPGDCEITEGATSAWILVNAYPGDDVRALRWLARRRFGAFSPQQQRRVRSRGGALVQGWEPAFPGWLFVLCWDVEKMYRRIRNCPGVMDVFCYPGTSRPVPISESFVNEVRALSWVYNEYAPHARHYSVAGARHVKRVTKASLGRKERKELQRLKDQVKRVGIWDDEEWQRANELDPGKRIALLKATLMSLAASGGSASIRT